MALRIAFVDGRQSAGAKQTTADQPMGGISSVAVGLRAELAKRGHDVHYFATTPTPRTVDGVSFHGRSSLADFARNNPVDALIVIPELLPVILPLRAKARVVWTGNAYRDGDFLLRAPFSWAPNLGRPGTEARLYSMRLFSRLIDRIIVGSEWQAQHLSVASSLPRTQFSVSYIGVPLQHYRGPAPPRHRHRLVYTSQSRRGLDILLHVFPNIRVAVPDAELHIFGAEYEPDVPLLSSTSSSQVGVHWRGAFSKSALAHELRSAAVMAYPCKKETFCLAVAEAQAAGQPVVATDVAAMSERVTDGVDGTLIRGKARKPEYQDAFVQAVVRILNDDELRDRMGQQAAEKAFRLYDWTDIAAGWEAELERLVVGREPQLPPIDPGLDLLRSEFLTVEAKDESAKVPANFAEHWLRDAWSAYGFDPNVVPGLPLGTHPRSSVPDSAEAD